MTPQSTQGAGKASPSVAPLLPDPGLRRHEAVADDGKNGTCPIGRTAFKMYSFGEKKGGKKGKKCPFGNSVVKGKNLRA